uniref:Uncharacterized protein n=1 Tax=Anguilla anguilla TaxID=7936 RepID=A0A0E9U3R4_ANGAN
MLLRYWISNCQCYVALCCVSVIGESVGTWLLSTFVFIGVTEGSVVCLL